MFNIQLTRAHLERAKVPKRKAIVRFENEDGETSTRRVWGRFKTPREFTHEAYKKLGGRKAMFSGGNATVRMKG